MTDVDSQTVMRNLVAPASIAIVGASDHPERIGGRPIRYMLDQGFKGKIYPINPNRKTVQGVLAYQSLEEIPEVPDVVLIAVSPSQTIESLEVAGRLGVRAAIIFSAGFSEVGAEGAELQQQLLAIAAKYGIRVLGPNTLGLFNARIGFYPIFSSSFEGGWPLPGKVGIASQSGAFAGHILTCARNRRIGVPICITTGNESDISLGEAIAYLAGDDGIDVIAVYTEGIKDVDSFLAALQLAHERRKPIVLMKTGRSRLGSAAAQSHTASIAGDDAVFSAVIADYGVVRAKTAEELLDIAHLATRKIYPTENTLGVLTISGGAGVLISDRAEELGISMPALPQSAQDHLKALLPIASVVNPVDHTAQVLNDINLVGQFADTLVSAGGYSSVLSFLTQAGGTPSLSSKLRGQLAETRRKYPDRLYVVSLIGDPDCCELYEEAGFTVFEDPSRAVDAIGAMHNLGRAFAKSVATLGYSEERHGENLGIVGDINEAGAKRILSTHEIVFPAQQPCQTVEQAITAAVKIGFPVVLKVLSKDIIHKSDVGGVRLGLISIDDVREAYAQIMSRVSSAAPEAQLEGVLVAKQLDGGIECIMGVNRDRIFGPIAMFGLGGVNVEIMRDIVFKRCPFDVSVAISMIESIKGSPLLKGYRGAPCLNVAALAQMLSNLSRFAVKHRSDVVSVELNPVLALPHGAYALDAVIQTNGGGQ